jgi:O-antigen/teichoic acid export membrane protein
LGALVLLPPFNFGFVGLAGVSVLMNVAQVIWLGATLRSKVLAGEPSHDAPSATAGASGAARPGRLDLRLQGHLLREAGPLMLNHLLATVFWRISQFVLRGATNAAALGIFSVGVKFLDGLNVIPSYFTLAIFPLMSRYAQTGGGSLARAYRLATQALLIAALPVAVIGTFAAAPLARLAGGAAYLPDAATALAIMIWSIPIGFVNSVTQYALIAAGQQRFLTRAFVLGVLFTGLANLIAVRRYGHLAAAVILIPAELSLFIPFAWAVRRHLGPMPWGKLLGRPLLATIANVALVAVCQRGGVPLLPALLAGMLAYAAALLALGAHRDEDVRTLLGLLRRQAPPAA